MAVEAMDGTLDERLFEVVIYVGKWVCEGQSWRPLRLFDEQQ